MPDDPEPFFKWDPDGRHAEERAAARALMRGEREPEQRGRRRDPLAGKRFLLRWAWAIGTAVLILGYVIMAVVLSGNGDHFGL